MLTLLGSISCGAQNGDAADSGSSAPSDAAPAIDSEVPVNAQRHTFAIDSFEVPANAELYKCQDFPNPFGKDIAIVKTESTMSPGAHHMFSFQIPATEAAFAPDAGLYAAEVPPVAPDGAIAQTFAPDGGKTPLFDCPAGGLEFHPYFQNSQWAHDSMTYPEGVGRSLKSTEAIRLNVHYLNVTASPIRVSAEATVTYVDPKAVKQLAAWMFLYSGSLEVPTGESTQAFAYKLPATLNLLEVNGHMHSRGMHFEAHVAAGATGKVRPLYSSDTWNEPVSLNFAPPFEIKSGDTLGYSCTYDNDTGSVLSYGESAVTNEMCNFIGVFYPSTNGTGLLEGL